MGSPLPKLFHLSHTCSRALQDVLAELFQSSPRSLPDLFQISPRALPELSQSSPSALPELSQCSPRALSDLFQISPRSLPALSHPSQSSSRAFLSLSVLLPALSHLSAIVPPGLTQKIQFLNNFFRFQLISQHFH